MDKAPWLTVWGYRLPSALWLEFLILFITSSLFILLLTGLAPVSQRGSDPRPALLVSQAILQEGTIRLDAYENRLATPLSDNYRILQHDGHYYYFFPLGSSVFSLPVVQVANWLGLDMAVERDNSDVQFFIGALTIGLSAALLYLIARCYLNRMSSLVITAVIVLGSSISSTMGTALWSTNFGVVFILLTLLLIVRAAPDRAAQPNPYLLGSLLFAAYFSRPSTAIFIIVTLLYLFWQHRPLFWRAALPALGFFLLFLLANWLTFGRPIPYYQTSALLKAAQPTDYAAAIYGVLFSPSRGLFIFSPMFLLVFVGGLLAWGRIQDKNLLTYCLAWITLQLLSLPLFTRWWGGWSYGPRLLTELVPAFALLTILLWREVVPAVERGRRIVFAAVFLLFGLPAIFIHSVQGLHNIHTARWNFDGMGVNIDAHPQYALDWRYPQFAATANMLCRRNLEYIAKQLAKDAQRLVSYEPGTRITYDAQGENARFAGWSLPEEGFRWSMCQIAAIFFVPTGVQRERSYRLTVTARSFGPQEVELFLNDERLGEMHFPGTFQGEPITLGLTFDGAQIQPGVVNQLAFHIPGARKPGGRDIRKLGLALASLTIIEQ